MALTNDQQYALLAQLGLLEGAKAGAFTNGIQQASFAALTPVASPNATDEATAVTLVNEIKTKVNNIIAALKL
ncbi:hypothetical protein QGX12_gp169 [Pseudomonas phage Kremar]|uniref:Uncharacterized protein n=1 Tax=Pseudomonas phage Kremar TaxID=2928831 RepID=A0AAE9GPK3_9CAUD|nr:hypothetical protein QGX12_gp169 [Pseudomonas phage Kremar]UOL48475.1 hypothetical protein [Pseudomonas phage Kremar]